MAAFIGRFDNQIIDNPKVMARQKSINGIFISRTREKMKDKSLNQSDLAYMSNIAQGTISEYLNPEKGRTPGAAELGRMAQALGVSMGWLWGLEGTSEIETDIYSQKIHRLEGRLLFAKKTLRGALEYLQEDVMEDEKLVEKTLSTQNDRLRVAEDEIGYSHNKNENKNA